MITVHLQIKGKVQGVFFRATAKRIAEKNNLTGWVRNKSNRDVEATVTGEKENVNTFVEWCKSGPEKAVVDEVIVTNMEETIYRQFDLKR